MVNSEGYLKLDPTQGSSGEKEILDLTKVEYVEAKVRDRNLPVKHR